MDDQVERPTARIGNGRVLSDASVETVGITLNFLHDEGPSEQVHVRINAIPRAEAAIPAATKVDRRRHVMGAFETADIHLMSAISGSPICRPLQVNFSSSAATNPMPIEWARSWGHLG